MLCTILFYIYIMDSYVDKEVNKVIEKEIMFYETLLEYCCNKCSISFWQNDIPISILDIALNWYRKYI